MENTRLLLPICLWHRAHLYVGTKGEQKRRSSSGNAVQKHPFCRYRKEASYTKSLGLHLSSGDFRQILSEVSVSS